MKKVYIVVLSCLVNYSVHAQCAWQSISAGVNHTVAIRYGGTLWAWGFNGSGQVGDGTIVAKKIPTQISTNTNWNMVSAGGNHALAIKTDGTLWAWGDNTWGQLGDGSYGTQQNSPVKIGTATNWKFVSAGRTFSLAIKTDGTLWAWGDNFYGQLGFASPVFTPTKVGSATDWKSVSAGGNHTLAIKTDGSLWAWGCNLHGELGDATTVNKTAPTKIGTDVNWSVVSAGYDFSIVLKTDGTLWAWGDNEMGQLGIGSYNDKHVPTQLGTAANWKSIGTGNDNASAIKADGTLWTWGWIIGKFGFSASDNSNNLPVQVGTDTDWTTVKSGDRHTFAFKIDANLWGWGDNTWGEVGNDELGDIRNPVFISTGTPTGAAIQSLCSNATVANLSATGNNIRWYATPTGGTPLPTNQQLVDGNHYYAGSGCIYAPRLDVTTVLKPTLSPPSGETSQVVCPSSKLEKLVVTGTDIQWYSTNTSTSSISTSTTLVNGSHYFASQTSGGCESPRLDITVTINNPPAPTGPNNQALCIGSRLSGLQANGTNIIWYQPQIYAGPILSNITLVTGLHYYATQTINGCESTQRLDVLLNLTENKTVAPIGLDQMVADQNIMLESFTGVIDKQGRLWGWGWNGEGQMADGTQDNKKSPVLVHEGPWKRVASGGDYVVAIKQDGSLWSWGSTQDGQLGIGENPHYNLSDIIQVGTETNWKEIAASYHTSAAIKNDGTLWTWGQAGELLGDNGVTYPSRQVPMPTGIFTNWNAIVGGYHYFLGLKTDGELLSGWGTNQEGELGDGTQTDRYTPTYNYTSGWKMVSGSYHYSAGIKTNGTLWTWGSNKNGGLGNGSASNIYSPTQVGSATDWDQVSAGSSHCLAIKTDGTLWGWGSNNAYQLGDGTTLNHPTPIQIGVDKDWKTVSAGSGASMAIKSDGTVWTWGILLGDGTTNTGKTPKQIIASLQYVCTAATVADLSVNGSDIHWYATALGGDPLAEGTVLVNKTNYYATQTVNGCESQTRLSVHIVKKDQNLPTPSGSASQKFCQGETVANLSPAGNNIKWYLSSSGGVALSPSTILINGNHYYASQAFGGCESGVRLSVTVEVVDPSPPTGESVQTFSSDAKVGDLVPSGPTINWYETISGGSPLPVTLTLINGKQYYGSQISGECESSTRLPVTVEGIPDATAPSLTSKTPTNGATNVTTGTTLQLSFSENVVLGSGSIRIFNALTDALITTIVLTSSNTSITSAQATITTSSTLPPNTTLYVKVDNGTFKDLAGNVFAGVSDKSWSFTTAPLLDTQAPLLNSKSPISNASNVNIGTLLQLNFSESITLGTGSIGIFDGSTDVQIATFVLTSSNTLITGTQATITPLSSLPSNMKLYLKVDNAAFKDLSGNAFAGILDKSWSFTTISAQPPTATALSPANGASNVSLITSLQITFSQNIVLGSGAVRIYNASTNTLISTVTLTTVNTKLSVQNATIVLGSSLPANTNVYVRVDAGAFLNTTGDAFVGINDTSWSFKTVITDKTPPAITSTFPANHATGIAVGDSLVIHFNEPVTLVGGVMQLEYFENGFIVFENINLTSTTVKVNGNIVIVTPSQPLPSLQTVSILIGTGSFKDLSNNGFAGISAIGQWNFTTVAAPDIKVPILSSTVPATGTMLTDSVVSLKLIFNEYVALSGGQLTVFESASNAIVAQVDLQSFNTQVDKATVTVSLAKALPVGKHVYVHVTTGAFTDMTGNKFAGVADKSWSFFTANVVTGLEGKVEGDLHVTKQGNLVRIISDNSEVVVQSLSDLLGRQIEFERIGNAITFKNPSSLFIVIGKKGEHKATWKFIVYE